MPSIQERYCQEIHEHFPLFHAGFPLNSGIRLGDFGYLRNDVFDRISNIGVAFDIGLEGDETDSGEDIDFSSAGSVDVHARAGVVSIAFREAHGIFLRIHDTRQQFVTDETALKGDLLDLFEQKLWNYDYVVVTRVLRSSDATLIMSSSDNASIVLEGAHLPQFTELGTARISVAQGIGVKALSTKDATPLFRLSKVKRKFLGGSELRTANLHDAGQPHSFDPYEIRRQLKARNQPIVDEFDFDAVDRDYRFGH